MNVYCQTCWWSDDWSGYDYGIDFDPSQPFVNQLRKLLQRVPVMNLFGLYTTLVNSDYTNMVTSLKNCYMVTYSDVSENLVYGSFVNASKDSVDNLMSEKNELCYETVNCTKCYRGFFSQDSEDCNNIYFSKNCLGCSDCFGCVNLRNKKYHIYNQPVSKEEFTAFIESQMQSRDSINTAKVQAMEYWNKFPQKFIHGTHNNNVSGDYIFNSKNTRDSYCTRDTEDSRFCAFVTAGLKDTYDFCNYGTGSSLLYEVLQAGDQVGKITCSWLVVSNIFDVAYSMFVVGGKSIFGSVGVKKGEYCILNKQYNKEEFEKLRAEIITQMNTMPYTDVRGNQYRYGEFFPAELSPFGYNETTAQEFFPLQRDKAKASGLNWREAGDKSYNITLTPEKLPEITAVPNSIVNEIIGCRDAGQCAHQCSTAFRIIPQELEFYRSMKLPLPDVCPNCRHARRLLQRNSIVSTKRSCQCAGQQSTNGEYQNISAHAHHNDSPCRNEFETTYPPNHPGIVYCEQCYQQEVV